MEDQYAATGERTAGPGYREALEVVLADLLDAWDGRQHPLPAGRDLDLDLDLDRRRAEIVRSNPVEVGRARSTVIAFLFSLLADLERSAAGDPPAVRPRDTPAAPSSRAA